MPFYVVKTDSVIIPRFNTKVDKLTGSIINKTERFLKKRLLHQLSLMLVGACKVSDAAETLFPDELKSSVNSPSAPLFCPHMRNLSFFGCLRMYTLAHDISGRHIDSHRTLAVLVAST